MDVSTGVPAVDTVLVWGGAISLLIGVGTAAWRVGRGALHLSRRTTQFFDDWYGEGARPGVAARPGVLERMSQMEERLAQVYHEVYPNGGDSLRDAVNQANDRLAILCPDPCVQEPPDPPDEPSDR
ncbi:hypothetical protein ABZ682_23255 [Streptomyces griseoviridis]|uniref:hypothetical protein n=1 Tax=Streptomyces griseoviridis TaxID=45398 RepID=UPI0033D913A3